MPADPWCNEICHAEKVERAGERNARNAIQRREIPCHLGLIYAEMRCDGTVDALLPEDIGFAGDGLGGDLSVVG